MPRIELLNDKARRFYDMLTQLNDVACEDHDEDLSQAIAEWINDNFKYDTDEKMIIWK